MYLDVGGSFMNASADSKFKNICKNEANFQWKRVGQFCHRNKMQM